MVFNQSLLCITPETFHPVDKELSIRKPSLMVNPEVLIPTEHKGIIAPKFVRVNNTPSPHHPHCQIEQGLCCDILNHLYFNNPIPLQNAEYRHFIERPASSLPLSSSPEVRLIYLDLPFKEGLRLSIMREDSQPDQGHCIQDSG